MDLSDCGKYAKVKGGKMAGRAYWVPVTALLTKAQTRAAGPARRRRREEIP